MIQIGNSFCLPSPATIHELFLVARDGGVIPDISLDPVLTSLLSLDSSEALEHQYSSLRRSLAAEQLANFNNNLTSELGGSSSVSYGGVGVIALALSVLFDLLAKQVRAQGPLTEDGPQRIFGISSSSRIGVIMLGYLQKVPSIANDHMRMAEVTEMYDNWLKLELIDHFERMTNKKKRMGTESMQQWLAGAALHLHLRIHQVRLQSVPAGSAESLRLSYKSGYARLVQGYSTYLRQNIKETPPTGGPPRGAAGRRRTSEPSEPSEPRTTNVTAVTSSRLSKTNMTRLTRRPSVGRNISISRLSKTNMTRLTRRPSVSRNISISRLSKTNMTRLTRRPSVGRNSSISRPSRTNVTELLIPVRRTNQTSSKVNRPNRPQGRGETATSIETGRADGGEPGSLTKPTGGRRPTNPSPSQGLLVVVPLKNVSHGVQHHACESPAIEQALVSRIVDAQDLQRNKEFFLYSERDFGSLLRQREDFKLK